jgi:hypothetical protein
MCAMAVNSGTCAPISGAPASLTTLQEFDDLVVNAMDLGGEVLVGQLRSAIADDEIAIGSVADRCLLSRVAQTSRFEGVRPF